MVHALRAVHTVCAMHAEDPAHVVYAAECTVPALQSTCVETTALLIFKAKQMLHMAIACMTMCTVLTAAAVGEDRSWRVPFHLQHA